MMLFDWRDAKAAKNLKKHKVSFNTASLVFDDPNTVFYQDRAEEDGKMRWHAVGCASGKAMITVVHTVTEYGQDDLYEIISAWYSTPKEIRLYQVSAG
jgi:uncharacterized DUF497 family protein